MCHQKNVLQNNKKKLYCIDEIICVDTIKMGKLEDIKTGEIVEEIIDGSVLEEGDIVYFSKNEMVKDEKETKKRYKAIKLQFEKLKSK